MKIAIDAGHGLNTSGKRTPDGIREWTLNNRVLLGFENEINKYKNVELVRLDDASGKNDVTLVNRTNKAKSNKCDILISIHHNAYRSVWGEHGGTETWIYNGRVSDALGKALNDAVVATLGLRNRGVKVGNMHMNREVPFPSALVEIGFMDSNTDKVIRDESKSREVGAAMAVAVAKLYNLSLKDVAPVRKTNEEIAAEVKLGKWGNDPYRRRDLIAAGYDPDAIQAIVNGNSPKPNPIPKGAVRENGVFTLNTNVFERNVPDVTKSAGKKLLHRGSKVRYDYYLISGGFVWLHNVANGKWIPWRINGGDKWGVIN